MKFSVGSSVFNGDINIGVVPGVFDAKELVLSALSVLIHNAEHKYVRFVRTLDKVEIGKCDRFITDGFAKRFPQIPSYNNVEFVWSQYAAVIVQDLYGACADYEMVKKYAKEDICKFENYDVLTQYNSYILDNNEGAFETAIKKAYELLIAVIDSAVTKARSIYTIRAYLEKLEGNVLYFPFNINYKGIAEMQGVKWVIVKEEDGIYRVDNLDENLDLRQCVNAKMDVLYSGRFFAKVTSYEVSIELIKYVEKKIRLKHTLSMKEVS